MPALTKNTVREFAVGDYQVYPVNANVRIYKGAAVSIDGSTGLAKPLAATEKFVGFALEEVNNTGGAASALSVTVKRKGTVTALPITGITITDNRATPVYASDDGTFTTTATGNSLIGKVRQVLSNGVADVDFNVLVTA